MIVIKVTNAKEVIKREKGWFVAKIAPYLFDIEAKVEEIIADEIKKVFQEKGIQANISTMRDDQANPA